MKDLGKSQQAVYSFICEYIRQKSFPPTVREICAAVGLKSTSTVHMHLKSLEEKGYITLDPAKQRTIALVKSSATVPNDNIRNIPHIGTVAAGAPIYAFDNVQERFPLPAGFVHGAAEDELFILDVKGDSMIEAGICSGDMLVVAKDIHVENGDVVVARVQGDTATVKRVYFEKEQIRLQPENSQMEPIYASYSDVEIVGKVVSLLRRY